jgi:trans-2,3-dihydro-3-hydroxyanthranilate isomerase
MQRSYVTIDVFTDRAFGGNPLAVVLDADGLSTAQMQSVAREFNYSETTFILPPADPANTAHVRIFTPAHEMPFAGHPNVGTALVLARRASGLSRVLFEEAAGLVPLEIGYAGGQPVAAELTAPRPFSRGANADPGKVAAALGLDAAEILTGTHRPTMGSVGAAFLFCEIAARDSLRACRPDHARLTGLLAASESVGIFAYTKDGADSAHDIHARMFFPLGAIVEDPATGSAAVALTALLAALAPQDDFDLTLRVGQGEDMGRPSLLLTRAVKRGGKVLSAHVGGGGVEIMQGTFIMASIMAGEATP